MPIRDRTPGECAERFRKHLAALISQTVPGNIPILVHQEKEQFWVSPWRGKGPVTVPVDTKFGKLFFRMFQTVEPFWDEHFSKYQLQTINYSYKIAKAADATKTPLCRWEYKRIAPTETKPPRHHMHVPVVVPFGDKDLDLDRLHLPTGWVLIEEVIRLLITEFGMDPPCGDKWAEKLAESENIFHTQFSGKRCKSEDCPYFKVASSSKKH